MFGNPTTTQGGHALKFYSDCRIEMSRSLVKDGEEVYGNLTKVKATKNKMSAPYRKSEFEIIYGLGIDKVGEALELLHQFELGRKYGKTYTFDDVKYDLDEFKQMILEDDDFFEKIKSKIINVIKNGEEDLEIEKKTEATIEVIQPQELTPDLFDIPEL
jgi:recombination protein RecA